MPSLELAIGGVPIGLHSRSARLIHLFHDYFRYYEPQRRPGAAPPDALHIELRLQPEPPSPDRLIPAAAALIAQTGIARFQGESDKRYYFDFGAVVFRVEPASNRAVGWIARQALDLPQVLANTYTLFPLLLLLRSRAIYHLHAAAVLSPRDELWLLCGGQRAGKTTLSTALALAGWRPLSDDSMLLHFDGAAPRLTALKKSFHLSTDLIERWPELHAAPRTHAYLDRSCVDGLGFFGTDALASASFSAVHRIVLPRIVADEPTRLTPTAKSEALRTLAEQSVFFPLWPAHTCRQWEALTTLARAARCYRLLSGPDTLAHPHTVAQRLLADA
jgi:hypothetical protein